MTYSQSESAFLLRGNRIDESAWRGALTLQGSAWAANSDPFGGYALDCSTGPATLPNNPRVSGLGAADWTLESWCKPAATTANGNYIASVGVSSAEGYASVSAFLNQTGSVGLLASYNGVSWVNVSSFSGGSVPNGCWSFLEFTRRGSSLIAAINGVDVVTYGITGALQSLSPGHILLGGCALSGYGPRLFQGLLGPMRFTQGIALRGSGGPLPVPTENFPPLAPIGMHQPVPAIYLSGGPSAPAGPVLSPTAVQIDRQDGGLYRIVGDTKKRNSLAPLRRRVQLYNQRDNRLIRETWSDAATGDYAFNNVRGGDGTTYFVAGFDHTNTDKAVIADQLVPEPMP